MSALDIDAYACGMAVAPGRFNEKFARIAVAGLGNAALTSFPARRVFRGRHANPRHQLPGMFEARQITQFRDQSNCRREVDSTHGLQGEHDRIKTPLGDRFTQCQLQPLALGESILDRASVFVERQLLPRAVE
ncbi:hypothetical protein LMG29542_08568 [Paraburkholderia humisilvae]|uniref:Uncharacterized protein n=1 Tax=Paraburkholderia humisilvae TaxID=627669 RepID=A0A6J5FD38_9BURK|nr:hypothetical protein LMG29542_08568 [Paraburkholderia humisilvae]